MKILSTACGRALLDFLYPAFCLHCNCKLNSPDKLLCFACYALVEWLDAAHTCPLCAVPLLEGRQGKCASCQKKPCYLQPHASLFAAEGPIMDLFFAFQQTLSKQRAKLFASFFVLQLDRLEWPVPDVIVPVPDSCVETWSQKKQTSAWVATELGTLLNVPVAFSLKHQGEVMLRKRAHPFPEKKVLLLTMDLKESQALQQARWRIQDLFTRNLYSLALIESRSAKS